MTSLDPWLFCPACRLALWENPHVGVEVAHVRGVLTEVTLECDCGTPTVLTLSPFDLSQLLPALPPRWQTFLQVTRADTLRRVYGVVRVETS